MKKIVLVLILGNVLTACVSTKNVPLDAADVEKSQPNKITLTKREKPDFSAMTAGKAAFGMLGAGAMISAGNKIVNENNVEDPARYIADGFAKMLAEKYKIPDIEKSETIVDAKTPSDIVVKYPDAGLLIDVQTVNWGFVYFPANWSRYRVIYSAKLRVFDSSSKKLLAEGFCSRVPEKNDSAPTHEELLDSNAERLKVELKLGAEECIKQLRDNILLAEAK